MMELWPFTNFHDLNLDWIIKKIRNVEDSEAAAKASEEAAADSARSASAAMGMALVYQNKAKDYRDEAHGFANDAQDSADSISGVVDQVNTNTSRIDNLIATAGDGTIPSELADLRVGYEGVTYTTAGTAVRTDVTLQSETFNDLLTLKPLEYKPDSSIGVGSSPVNITPRADAGWSSCVTSCNPGDIFSVKGRGGYGDKLYAFLDSSYNVIEDSGTWVTRSTYLVVKAPVNAAYFVANSDESQVHGSAYKGNIWKFILDNALQVFFDNDDTDIEESGTDEVYLKAGGRLRIFYTPQAQYTINYVGPESSGTGTDIATTLNTTYTTSPGGIQNCIAINSGYTFVFSMDDKTIEIKNKDDVTPTDIVLIASNNGRMVTAHPYFLKIYSKKDNSVNGRYIPAYWNSAITTAENSINTEVNSDEKAAVFGFVTDTHIGSNSGYSGSILAKVIDDCKIPVWFHGGDAVTGDPVITKENLIAQMEQDFRQFASIENIGLRAIGNHDPAFGTSNYNYNLKNAEINNYFHGVDAEKYLQVYGNKKGYFYKDIHKDKLRCIVLDIIQYESQVDSDDLVTGYNKMYYHQFGSEQLAWFAEVLKSTPENYNVVVCSHIAPVSEAELQTLDPSWNETVPVDYMQARKIAQAYKNKSSYSYSGTVPGDHTGDTYNINVNFQSSEGEFVCFFCGHTHKDFMLRLDGVQIVGTANDSSTRSSIANSYAPSKTVGTTTEHILDFFVVKPTTRSVSVIRLGAYLNSNGLVRTFTY